MDYVLNSLEWAGMALQVFVVLFLFFGSFRKYALLLTYCIVQLAATVAEILLSHEGGREAGRMSPLFIKVYWTDEIVVDSLLFLLVIVLTYRALEGKPQRAAIGKVLAGVVAIAALAPFVVFYGRPLFKTSWFNGTSQFLNFGAALMNLALWTAMLSNKRRDAQLLAVSAGLGVLVTGAALGYGLRQFTMKGGSARDLANLFKSLTYVTSMLIWCWAFRPAARKAGTPPAAVPSPSIQS
jgi:hypothetical protein